MISGFSKDSKEQVNEVRKSVQDLDEKSSTLDKKFSKEIKILEINGNFKIKSSIVKLKLCRKHHIQTRSSRRKI
jgi:acetyl-CoA carboxylase alpha subunit